MKLVEILAKELGEWPDDEEENYPVKFVTQNEDRTIMSWNDDGELSFKSGSWEMAKSIPFDELYFDNEGLATDHATAIVTREMWQAERERSVTGVGVSGDAVPLQWRDRIREIDADIEAMTAERAELVSKLADEGFALIAVAAEPADDFGSWLVGDIVECTASEFSFISVGTKYEITGFDEGSICFIDDDGDRMDYGGHNFKFHSRPTA